MKNDPLFKSPCEKRGLPDFPLVPLLKATCMPRVAGGWRSRPRMCGSSARRSRLASFETFCAQNEGDGWMLPQGLCLADLGLGHDEHAKEAHPARARLSER